MKPYLAVLKARMRTMLQYRAAAWAGFVTQSFFGLVLLMVYSAFYSSSGGGQPMSFDQIVDYVWLGQALFALLPLRLDTDVAEMIRSGNVAYELVRPADLYSLWFCRALAQRTVGTLMRALPLILLSGFLFPLIGLQRLALGRPASLLAGLLFCGSLASAVGLTSAITALMSITLFWTISSGGIATLLSLAAVSLSGIILPLPFFPDWLQPILMLLPFRGLMDVPFRIYIGNILPVEALLEIAGQVFWCVVLITSGRLLLARGLKRVVVQGG